MAVEKTELEKFKEEQTEAKRIRRILRKAKVGIEKEKVLKKEIKAKKVKAVKERIEKIGKVAGKKLGKLEKAIAAGAKERQKRALLAEIGRQKLLQAIVSRQREGRSVSILRRIEDKIPDVFTTPREKKEKPTFFSRGGLI